MPKFNPFKYYVVGTQITITILSAIFIGYQLDNFLKIKNYYITIILAISTIFYALYRLINRIKKEK